MTPAGCQVPSGTAPQVAASYKAAADDATAHTFADSFTQAMWSQVAIYLLVLGLLFFLPQVNPRQLAEIDDAVYGSAA